MSGLSDLLAAGQPVEAHRPWPRVQVDAEGWRAVIAALAAGDLTLLSLWGEPGTVHMAVLSERDAGVFSLACTDGHYPSVGARHPPAIRLERAVHDLFGTEPDGLPDTRPWLDHGKWSDDPPQRYTFLPVEGEALHQIPVGPVHAGIIEPGHFRFTCDGETVVRVEQRLGYTHKGVDLLMGG
ncbi:MAG TPA: NADH-quinone oxidoreductase subunit C, partial [Rhodopila sp.]|nr:NADH-quinone oxidoreductase subunit C [Rhodopila sp.]